MTAQEDGLWSLGVGGPWIKPKTMEALRAMVEKSGKTVSSSGHEVVLFAGQVLDFVVERDLIDVLEKAKVDE